MNLKAEEQRTIISLGILGTVVAVQTILPRGYWSLVGYIAFASGIFAFVYLILTGTYLKYKGPGVLGPIKFPESLRERAFDISIDLYGLFFMTLLILGAPYVLLSDKPESIDDVSSVYLIIGGVVAFIFISKLLTMYKKELPKGNSK